MKKIQPERSMATMPEDEKSVINRLQFDEMQKQLGKPQSHELKVHDMLKKGWDAEGSPFKGQDFDPKMFDINSSAVQMWPYFAWNPAVSQRVPITVLIKAIFIKPFLGDSLIYVHRHVSFTEIYGWDFFILFLFHRAQK